MPHLGQELHACQAHAAGTETLADLYVGTCSAGAGNGDFVPSSTLPKYAPDTVIQSTHIDISLDFSEIEHKRAKAQIVHTFANTCKSNASLQRGVLSTVKLNGVGFLEMAVKGDGLASWTYDGEHVCLHWDTPFAPEEKRDVSLTYKIEQPIIGLCFEVPTKEYPDRALHAITDLESERCRYWLACIDFPVVRTTLKFNLRAPSDMHAIANGAFVGTTDHDDNSKTTEWALDTPCPSYLICFAVGRFEEVVDEEVNGIPVKYYAPKGTPHDDMRRLWGRTPAMMRWLPKKVGMEFPWPKYYQIASPHVGGAMENISFVTWGQRLLMDENYASDRQLELDSVNIHEMAHTYFGDLLVIRHFEHVWLKESWATYMQACYLEDNVSKDEADFEMLGNAEYYIAETGRYMRPMVTRTYDVSWNMFDMHTYPGGAWRIHMLRKLLGDEAFWDGVQSYVRMYRTQVVETDEFRRCLEKASGLNLVKFFDQWFYSKGFPQMKGTFDFSQDKKQVSITLEQTQVDKAKSIGLFDCTVEIEVTDADHKTYTGHVVFQSDNESSKSTLILPIGKAKPAMVRVDPGNKLLFSLEMSTGEDVLVNTAKGADDVPNRVWAYKELITRNGTYPALNKVKEAVLAEKFYGVRIKVANALGKSKTKGAIKVLLAMLKADTDPRVTSFIINALHVRDEDVRDALIEYIKRKNLSYRTHASALEGLGLQRHPDDVKLLLSIAQDDSQIGQHAWVRSAALRALGKTRDSAAFEYLLTRLAPGKEPEDARPAVIAAIATAAQWQQPTGVRTAIELLVEYLHDDAPNVRLACIAHLCSPALEAHDAAPSILATRPLWDPRDWNKVTRAVSSLRSTPSFGPGGASAKLRELMKSVEEMEAKIRKLEDKDRERDAQEKAVVKE
ncbi:hypothetical protein DFJ77DRAFT_461715 [Powellomyces hirtus]|nr:hypothetical protein DFJ77DRAFT_461715 [Powellomyces hirtus]